MVGSVCVFAGCNKTPAEPVNDVTPGGRGSYSWGRGSYSWGRSSYPEVEVVTPEVEVVTPEEMEGDVVEPVIIEQPLEVEVVAEQ